MDEAETAAKAPQALDVLICVAGELDGVRLSAASQHAAEAFARTLPGTSIGIARMSLDEGKSEPVSGNSVTGIQLLTYKLPSAATPTAAWRPSGAVYTSIFALARTVGARVCVVLHADLAALEHGAVANLAEPILAGDCELVMPVYTQSRFEGLLNAAILAPLTRALYGKRVRYPLAQDFAVSRNILPLFERPAKRTHGSDDVLFWPATQAAMTERKICQAHVDVHHETVAEGVDLSTVLSQILGPLFSDMEANASVWQRVRGSQNLPLSGVPLAAYQDQGRIDPRPMIESFLLAARNLQEVWSLILPPVTQLDLKKLARMAPEQFHLPDALWVRIIYDFALAHRLRIMSRSHLMGALTPLYLAWVASYAGEVASVSDAEADARLEQLAIAFEAGKPHLQSRWRWPDRFNP